MRFGRIGHSAEDTLGREPISLRLSFADSGWRLCRCQGRNRGGGLSTAPAKPSIFEIHLCIRDLGLARQFVCPQPLPGADQVDSGQRPERTALRRLLGQQMEAGENFRQRFLPFEILEFDDAAHRSMPMILATRITGARPAE